jgi:hypothetical protein
VKTGLLARGARSLLAQGLLKGNHRSGIGAGACYCEKLVGLCVKTQYVMSGDEISRTGRADEQTGRYGIDVSQQYSATYVIYLRENMYILRASTMRLI